MRVVPALALATAAIVSLALTATQVSPALSQQAGMTIVPGHALGPVTLGMPATEAREAAEQFERKTGCYIDLLVAREVVIAAGSRWGGCLDLLLPRNTQPMAIFAGPFSLPLAVGIGGPAVALVNAFGTPLVVRQAADEAALIFPNGLVAHVGGVHAQGGVVTYLAVQAPGSRSVPQIGHFTAAADAPAW